MTYWWHNQVRPANGCAGVKIYSTTGGMSPEPRQASSNPNHIQKLRGLCLCPQRRANGAKTRGEMANSFLRLLSLLAATVLFKLLLSDFGRNAGLPKRRSRDTGHLF
jgi:hypothetical protein